MFAYFKHVADQLEGITPDGAGPTGRGAAYDRDTDAIRRWARANGHVVNDRGRVPADIRKAYESPR
ncbi:histone-like nucleoid-structuring protein Lsr2 [Streptomyces fructofermentans]